MLHIPDITDEFLDTIRSTFFESPSSEDIFEVSVLSNKCNPTLSILEFEDPAKSPAGCNCL